MNKVTGRILQYTCVATALWIGGCVNLPSVAPGTAASEVEARAGKPHRVWPEANGASSWEYPQGPAGHYTYMVRVGADGRVRAVDQVLDWPTFNQLRPGMKVEEVEHLLGRPYRKAYMPLINETVWSWRWMETVWKRCFYAYIDPQGTLVKTGVSDEDVADMGVSVAIPC